MPDAELDARTSLLTDDERAWLEHREADSRTQLWWDVALVTCFCLLAVGRTSAIGGALAAKGTPLAWVICAVASAAGWAHARRQLAAFDTSGALAWHLRALMLALGASFMGAAYLAMPRPSSSAIADALFYVVIILVSSAPPIVAHRRGARQLHNDVVADTAAEHVGLLENWPDWLSLDAEFSVNDESFRVSWPRLLTLGVHRNDVPCTVRIRYAPTSREVVSIARADVAA